MLYYLIERDKEENFRTSTRTLKFPDGETHRVTSYRLTWRWFDHMIAYEFGYSEEDILRCTTRCAETEIRELGEALGEVMNYLMQVTETEVGDITDDNIALMLAQKAGKKFNGRKGGPGRKQT